MNRAAPGEAQKGRIPDFFIVGHGKSGTTALYDALRRHPQIYMPTDKEPWFLAGELNGAAAARPPRQGRTPKTLQEYLSLFAQAGPQQRVGEASSPYLWSRSAAGRIAELAPAARIVAALREPAGFLRSLHMQFVQNYIESEQSFRRALELEPARRRGRRVPRGSYWPQAVLYSEHVRYVEQLRRYEDRFPAEQIMVLIYDDFRSDNEATLRRVLRFLQVDDAAPIAVREVNPTVRIRSQRLYALAHRVAVNERLPARAARTAARTLAPARLSAESALAIRNRLFFGSPQPPEEELMRELRRRFKGEVVALSEHLGRDLVTLWGYDQLD